MKLENAYTMWESRQTELHILVNCRPNSALEALCYIKNRITKERDNNNPTNADLQRMKKYAEWLDCLTTILSDDKEQAEKRISEFSAILKDIDGMLKIQV